MNPSEADKSVSAGDFAERLASASPTPGGGAAAARAGLLAASLVRMVTSISLAKAPVPEERQGTEGFWRRVEEIAEEAREISVRFRQLELEDMRAFEAFLGALRLPKSSDEEKAQRGERLRKATREAIEAPLDTLAAALDVLELARQLLTVAGEVRLRAESDLGAAIEMAHAAFRSAELNVHVNLPGLASDPSVEAYRSRHESLRETFETEYPELRQRVLEWLGAS